jgi:hypothetical protein
LNNVTVLDSTTREIDDRVDLYMHTWGANDHWKIRLVDLMTGRVLTREGQGRSARLAAEQTMRVELAEKQKGSEMSITLAELELAAQRVRNVLDSLRERGYGLEDGDEEYIRAFALEIVAAEARGRRQAEQNAMQ